MTFTPVHAIALLVFLGAIAGATYGVQQVVGDAVAGSLVALDPAHDELSAAAGHDVTFPVTLRNRDAQPRDAKVVVAAEGFSGETGLASVPENGAATVFLTVRVPADAAEGAHKLGLRIVDAAGATSREAPDALTVRVIGDAPSFGPNDSATILYTGRIAETGTVFFSNDPALAALSFPRVDNYRAGTSPVRVTTTPEPSVIEGLYRGMLGMRQGESRAVAVPPEQGFGPATITEERPRVETLERERDLPIREQTAPRSRFDQHVRDTGQGDPAAFEAGDKFLIRDPSGADLPYLVVALDAEQVQYHYAPDVGDRLTLYAPWPNASEVVAVGNATVRFRTTPTTAEGEPFTYLDHWPNMTAVASLDASSIVLRHTPPVGQSHEERDAASPTPRRYEVSEVREDAIVLAYPSDNPLAGRTLVFDVRLVELTKA